MRLQQKVETRFPTLFFFLVVWGRVRRIGDLHLRSALWVAAAGRMDFRIWIGSKFFLSDTAGEGGRGIRSVQLQKQRKTSPSLFDRLVPKIEERVFILLVHTKLIIGAY